MSSARASSGGGITSGIAWEWIFWLNVPIGAVLLPLVLRRIDESPREDNALDGRGLALITLGVLGIVWGLMRGGAVGWGAAEVVASLLGGALALVAFIAVERRSREPMLAMDLFSSRAFSAGNAATFALFAAIFVGVFFIAQFLQTVLGYTPLEAGLRLLPWTGLLFVVAPIAGLLADRIGERPLLVGGLALQGVGYGWLALIAEPGLAYSQMVPSLVVTALGGSLAIPPAASVVLRSIPHGAIGKAAGANGMLRELGGVFGIAVSVAVFAGAGSYASAQAFSDGFAAALAVPVVLSLLGAIVSLAIPRKERTTTPEPASGPGPLADLPALATRGPSA